ncbi:uncharacterized protein N7469_006135 [Penicillium citrinum]|uniref:Uncharacterized protein n=1 Tax=Penicillium citrinum TaxID=5077 RepID=A0A9W9TMA5_PENCI|nr:uncharacterized protein N7469_006135 [Penicillium citrinum]KAJ5231547.1 hypothetical protein N7469_006135 [Penicillium citrinum]
MLIVSFKACPYGTEVEDDPGLAISDSSNAMLRVGGNPAMTDLSDELPYFLFVPLIELTHQTIGQEELRIRIASALQMWLFDQAAPRIQERGMILSSTFQQQNKAIER